MDAKRARFEDITLPYAASLYHVALRWTKNRDDASDLVQETYLRAYQGFANFVEGTNCKAWLFTIMYSIFVNQYRKRRREGPVMTNDEIEQKFYSSISTNTAEDSDIAWIGEEIEGLSISYLKFSGVRSFLSIRMDLLMKRPPAFWTARLERCVPVYSGLARFCMSVLRNVRRV